MNYAYFLIPVGAVIGTLFRWKMSLLYNHLFPLLPLGTLLVNLLGSYLIGVLLGVPNTLVSVALKSNISIGFLGGLTTFSAFAAEAVILLSAQEYKYAVALIASHLVGGLLLTVLGMYTAVYIFGK